MAVLEARTMAEQNRTGEIPAAPLSPKTSLDRSVTRRGVVKATVGAAGAAAGGAVGARRHDGSAQSIDTPISSFSLDTTGDFESFMSGEIDIFHRGRLDQSAVLDELQPNMANEPAAAVGELEERTDEERVLSLVENIDAFMGVEYKKLVTIWRRAGVLLPIEGGSKPAPNLQYPEIDGGGDVAPAYSIAKDDPENPGEQLFFPNLGVQLSPQKREGGITNWRIDTQGLDLGGTAHTVNTTLGKAKAYYRYYGMVFGDGSSDNEPVRYVAPMFVGLGPHPDEPNATWVDETNLSISAANESTRLGPPDKAALTQTKDAIKALDQLEVNPQKDEEVGVTYIQHTGGSIPDNAKAIALSYNLHPDLFEDDFLVSLINAQRKFYYDLRALTLLVSKRDGYRLYRQNGPDTTIPVEIKDAHMATPADVYYGEVIDENTEAAILGTRTIEQILAELPVAEDYIAKKGRTLGSIQNDLFAGALFIRTTSTLPEGEYVRS